METQYKPYRGKLWDVCFHTVNVPAWDGMLKGQHTLRMYATGFTQERNKSLGTCWRTSLIVSHNESIIETLNSVYRIMSYSEENPQ